ncbi:MAG: hypothetical protein CVV14_12800 [Gammaproteobacteria bacterium HGW-Gammaproteobacteria-4]|jgi:hypothetical protein|nr:MAG: hypothetical protein CVV14_12800 [Gammaproteobacteria bacterium HGW-Gammaproteobacteria-4]
MVPPRAARLVALCRNLEQVSDEIDTHRKIVLFIFSFCPYDARPAAEEVSWWWGCREKVEHPGC